MAELEIDTIVDDEAAVARVTVKVGDLKVTRVGSSKKHPKDVSHHATGEALAVARALKKIQSEVERYAKEQVDLSEKTINLSGLFLAPQTINSTFPGKPYVSYS